MRLTVIGIGSYSKPVSVYVCELPILPELNTELLSSVTVWPMLYKFQMIISPAEIVIVDGESHILNIDAVNCVDGSRR